MYHIGLPSAVLSTENVTINLQRWSRGHKARGQGQGLGQTLSRPRPRTKVTGASVLKKKEGLQKFFSSNLKKKAFKTFFSGDFHFRKTKKGLRKFSARFLALSNKISTVQKIVLSWSRGQAIFEDLRLQGQDFKMCPLRRPRGLHLCKSSHLLTVY